MASGLLLLLDDISTILDDVALLTKVAAKKAAGVLGDDLALNAQQVAGVAANRELPIVWAVAKGSLVNKLILVPSALLLSAAAPWAIQPLLVVGGAYLCFEGCEKLAHKFFHPELESQHRHKHEAAVADPTVDLVAVEKSKIKAAVRTDFILSAEIIVIALGTVAKSVFITRFAVLVCVALLMTVGVYGLVAGIVKLDDLGLKLIKSPTDRTISARCGRAILAATPPMMKFLSIAGTAAMFLVGGGILLHAVPNLHRYVEGIQHRVEEIKTIGGILAATVGMAVSAALGLLIGTTVLLVANLFKAGGKKFAGQFV